MAAVASLLIGRSGGHPSHGAKVNNERTFQPDHSREARSTPYAAPIFVLALTTLVMTAAPAFVITATPAAAKGFHHTGGDRQQSTDENKEQS